MKKVTFCFITIVLILTLGGMGLAQGLPSLTESSPVPPSAPLPTPVTVPSSNLLLYSNPTHGFSFNYPSNWKQNTEVDGTGFLKTRFYLLEGDNTVALFSVFSSQVESSLSQWAITQEEIMINHQEMPGYKKISEEAISLGGLPAIKRLYTYLVVDEGSYSQIPVKGVDIYLVENNKGYVLAGEAVQGVFDRILPEVEIIFNSFKLSVGVSETTIPVSVLPPVTITPEPPSTFNLFQYTDPTCSFSFNITDNWKEFEGAGGAEGTLKTEIGFWEGDQLLACFLVFVNDTDLSLSQYSMLEEEWMMNPQNIADYRKISEEAINIGGLPAIQRLYTYTYITNDNSKIPLKVLDVYIVNNNKSYMLVGEVDQDKFDGMLADLAIMFNSFTITGKPVIDSSETDSSTTSETAFKFCPYCGVPLQADYQFCPGCGKPITIQRTIKAPKEEGVGSDKETRINYSVNFSQTRGLPEELNQPGDSRGIDRSFDKPFKSFKPAFISNGFGSKLLPNSIGRKISSQIMITRSSYPENLNFSYLEGLGKQIAFNADLETTYRGGINQLGSSLKNLGEGISTKMVVSQVLDLQKTRVLRDSKRGAQEDVSMGSLIGGISSKIGSSVVDQTRSSSYLLWECLSTVGQGITYEIGAKREAQTLPSIAPTSPETTSTLPIIPPSSEPGGIVNQTIPVVPTPPPPPEEPSIIWKQYSLSQAFGRNPLIIGYLEYPSTWLINLDSFNKNVTFSEDTSGLTYLAIYPGLMGQFSTAQELAQQMAYMLMKRFPDLVILNEEFKIIPNPSGGAIEVTEGKVNLQGSYQGTAFRFNLETYVLYMGSYGAAPGMSGTGYAIITQAPQDIFAEKEQKIFNRMILSYKRALGVMK